MRGPLRLVVPAFVFIAATSACAPTGGAPILATLSSPPLDSSPLVPPVASPPPSRGPAFGGTVGGLNCLPPAPSAAPGFDAVIALATDDGKTYFPPSGIGVGAACSYPVTTRTDDGLIHVAAQPGTDVTLGAFLAVWAATMPRDRVLEIYTSELKTAVVRLNGTIVTTDPLAIQLTPFAVLAVTRKP